jgi:hypothetical protein
MTITLQLRPAHALKLAVLVLVFVRGSEGFLIIIPQKSQSVVAPHDMTLVALGFTHVQSLQMLTPAQTQPGRISAAIVDMRGVGLFVGDF